MPQLFIILLKINLVLILFSAAYYLVLRRLTFYVPNRIFLVFGILFSTIYPFIDLTDFFKDKQQVVAFVPQLNRQVIPSNFITEHWQLISTVFYIGVLLMAVRLIVQFVSLYQLHKSSTPGAVADFPVRILHEPVSPFSFWQTVYINPSLHKEGELETILAHENIHVKEWHSLDIILAELSVVFYWFNPGVWLMKKAVKENLEFITDAKILRKGVDKKAYQYSLLDVGSLKAYVPIVNSFNLSDLKKRLRMMNAKRSSRLTLGRYFLVLPVLLLTTLAFTISKQELKKHLIPLKQAFTPASTTNVADNTDAVKDKAVKKLVSKKKKPVPAPVAVVIDSVVVGHRLTERDYLGTPLSGMTELQRVKGTQLNADQAAMPKIRLEGKPYTGPVDSLSNGTKHVSNHSQEPIVVIGYPSKTLKNKPNQ